ncbi:MAG TPA: YcnI family protein [Acidimicrobiia bacterium]
MLRRVGVAGLLMGAVVVVGGPAWAHVTVSPSSAPKGSDAVLAFNVADESDTASTTQVEIFFPTDHPIADALVEPIPGWTAKVETMKVAKPIQTDSGSVTEAVKKVTWSGGKIEPGQFQHFSVSVGLPDAASLEFKALQTYSDGTVTRWIEDTPPGGPEPENPAPVLTLTSGSDASTTPTTAAGTSGLFRASASKSDVDSAKSVSIVAIVVGALGLVVALGAFVLGRRPRRA